VYVLKARISGKPRWLTIGRHGAPWTPEKARREAQRLLGEIAAGHDPAAAREDARRDLTIAELCDLYLAEGCMTKKASTLTIDRGRIERHIKPLLGKKHVQTLTRADVQRFLHDIAAGKTAADIKTGSRGRAIVKGGKGTAGKAVALMGAIFTFAIDRGLRPDNPAHGIKTFQTKKLERFLSQSELAHLGEALAAAEAEGVNTVAVAAIRFLVLSGVRKSEALLLKWDEVDFERSCLRLADSKTGAKTVALGAAALSLLDSLPRFENNPHVFPGSVSGGPFVGLPKIWYRIRERADLQDVRLHDLRHHFASTGAASGDSLLIIGKLLGHRSAATTQRYAHLSDDPVRAAANRISDQIANAMTPKDDNGEVVPLPQRNA
jgi:integrase